MDGGRSAVSYARALPPPEDGQRTDPDAGLLDRLREHDEAAFGELVARYHGSMRGIAALFVPSLAIAEEVVQDTWIAILSGLPRFEGHSSLRTWMLRILTNRARSRGQREGRSRWVASLEAEGDHEAAVDSDRFSDDPSSWPGHWRAHPRSWQGEVEERLLSKEWQAHLRTLLEDLPLAQRIVVMLRDIEGWPARDVCLALDISSGNQRVLLHRARARLRSALEARPDAT